MNKKAAIYSAAMILGLMAWTVVLFELFVYGQLTKTDILIFLLALLVLVVLAGAGVFIYTRLKKRSDFHQEIAFEFFEHEGQIVIKFNVATRFIMLDPGQAVDLARVLKKRGQKLLGQNRGLSLVNSK